MRVRAKMTVTSIEEFPNGYKTVNFNCVYSDKGENKDFTDATPSGGATLSITGGKPAGTAFKPGDELYVDFIPVAEAVA